jgi:hypothetical protein
MNPAPWSLVSAWAAFSRGWNRFFHEPCDARICAAIRIVYATLVLIHLATLYPDLELWFTETGLLPLDDAKKLANPHSTSLLEFLPGTSRVVQTCFWVTVAHAVCLLIGLLPRINACFLFVWIFSFQLRNNLINDSEDTLMRMMGFFLIWMPTGYCWSMNALIRSWWQGSSFVPRLAVPGWPLRLLQIQMAALFFSTALVKLGGDAWLNGTALYYVSRLDDHFGRFPVPAWLFDTPWLVALITWSVLLAELFIPLLIWFRETRIPCLLVLVFFHLANEWTMNLFLFHWLMLCGWISFVTPADFSFLSRRTGG